MQASLGGHRPGFDAGHVLPPPDPRVSTWEVQAAVKETINMKEGRRSALMRGGPNKKCSRWNDG
jgi:hypothetical protein